MNDPKFKVGDRVRSYHLSNTAWISSHDMFIIRDVIPKFPQNTYNYWISTEVKPKDEYLVTEEDLL